MPIFARVRAFTGGRRAPGHTRSGASDQIYAKRTLPDLLRRALQEKLGFHPQGGKPGNLIMATQLTIVFSTPAMEFLRRIDRPEREFLKNAIVSQLRSGEDRAIPVASGTALLLEIVGYLVVYRPMTGAEMVVYDASSGYFVVSVRPLWRGYLA
jgi:hypothetical protein